MNSKYFLEKLASAKGKVSLLKKQKEENTIELEDRKATIITLEEAQSFIQSVAKETQEQLKFHIEDVVQLALDSLFPNEYRFAIEFDIKYGKTAANLVFTKGGYPIDILKAAGGGVVDIASLALRVAVWSLSKTDNVLILDEPIHRIQPASLQSIAWEVIKELSRRLKLQFIIVSNSTNNGEATSSIADRVFRIVKEPIEIREETYDVSIAEVIE